MKLTLNEKLDISLLKEKTTAYSWTTSRTSKKEKEYFIVILGVTLKILKNIYQNRASIWKNSCSRIFFFINLFCFIYCFLVVMYPFEGPFAPLMSIKKFASFLLGEQTISEKIILSWDLCLVIDDHLFFRDSYKKWWIASKCVATSFLL